MRRVLALLATTAMLIAGGCGVKNYEERLTRTLDDMRYNKRLDDLLLPAVTKGQLEKLSIYVRPPKGLQGPAKETQLVVEPGKFEDVETFYEADKQNLHILSRVKLPKPATKKGAPAPEAPTPRGEFTPDVVSILNSYYSVDIDPTKAKEEKKKRNTFKRLAFEAGGKNVQVYIRSIKGDPYEVALVFDYPKSEQASIASKIELTLESMRVGDRARSAFNGSEGEDAETIDGASSSAGGAPAF
jgi:hypothetical protein